MEPGVEFVQTPLRQVQVAAVQEALAQEASRLAHMHYQRTLLR